MRFRYQKTRDMAPPPAGSHLFGGGQLTRCQLWRRRQQSRKSGRRRQETSTRHLQERRTSDLQERTERQERREGRQVRWWRRVRAACESFQLGSCLQDLVLWVKAAVEVGGRRRQQIQSSRMTGEEAHVEQETVESLLWQQLTEEGVVEMARAKYVVLMPRHGVIVGRVILRRRLMPAIPERLFGEREER